MPDKVTAILSAVEAGNLDQWLQLIGDAVLFRQRAISRGAS